MDARGGIVNAFVPDLFFFDSTEKQSTASRNPIWLMLRQDWQQEENGYRGKD